MVDASVIEELIPFLSPSSRSDVRNTALIHVAGVTATKEGRLVLGTQLVPLAEALAELTHTKVGMLDIDREQAFYALVNLTSEDSFAEQLVQELKCVPHLLQTVVDPDSSHARPASMILSNLTRNMAGAEKVLALLLDNKNEPVELEGSESQVHQGTQSQGTVRMNKLVEAFCIEGYNKKNSRIHFVGPLLANLTQLREGRKLLLDRDHCIIQRLLPFTQYEKSEVRKRGIITALKNCCFETASHEWLLSDEVDILPHLLLPLAGPEELSDEDMEGMPDDLQYLDEDKKREGEPEIRAMLLEAVYQLCATQAGRQLVKDKRTYVILREYHKWEKEEEVSDLCHKVIDVLIMDDPKPGMENLREVEIPEEVKTQLDQMEEVEKAGE